MSYRRCQGNHHWFDFENDVVPVSNFAAGGSVTERHVMYALALKIASQYGDSTVDFFENKLGIALSEKQKAQIAELKSQKRDLEKKLAKIKVLE